MKIVCIIGMGRSGTSLMCQILSRLGVYFGEPDELIGANSQNERGHYEHAAINVVLERALAANGTDWLTADPISSEWFAGWDAYYAGKDITRYISAGIERVRPTRARVDETGRVSATLLTLGFKNPRTTLFLPLFDSVFAALDLDPIYIRCLRDPHEVHASINRLNSEKAKSFTLRETLAVWANYYIESQTAEAEGALDVWFDDWFENPVEQLARVCSHIGTNLVYGTMSAALDAIDPKLQHYGVVARRLPYGLVHAQGETK